MNILAHLHLASLAGSSIIGNAAADFVKGDPYRQYPPMIADGIMLHRRLDKCIDQLRLVKQAKLLFRQHTQRVAPITLDIVWDHFLSKHWHNYLPNMTLVDFSAQMKVIIDRDKILFSPEFNRFMHYLWQDQWLINYADLNFIQRVLNGMANQRPKLSVLRETFTDITAHYSRLEQDFFTLYPSLIEQAINQQL